MALSSSYIDPQNGLLIKKAYIIVASLTLWNTVDMARIEFEVFVSKEARKKEKDPYKRIVLEIVQKDFMDWFADGTFKDLDEDASPIQTAYNYLKTTDHLIDPEDI